jgi:HTH-type transcriptional regulator/antitoxin HipB
MFIVTNPAQLTPYLRSLRRARGLTQADVGARLGVSAARISTIERNPGVLSTALLLRLLHVLGARLELETDATRSSKGARRRGAASTGEW